MISKKYQKKTNRSRRNLQDLSGNTVKVTLGGGQAKFQMVLPMDEVTDMMAIEIEKMASQAGILMMKALLDEEVEGLVGPRHNHDQDRQAYRWGNEEGHVVFAGRKVAIDRPRVRSKGGNEIPLERYQYFRNPQRLQEAVEQKIIRRVSCREYEGVIDDLCDGYGIDKSSVSRQWKAASSKKLKQMLERDLSELGICVIFLDGKEFHDYTLITALGVDSEGRKHILGLWPGATENADVCGSLLDELMERGLPADEQYLFVLDGSKALHKAVVSRFGSQALIQRCRIHKERNIKSYLPQEKHKLLSLKLKKAWGMTDYAKAQKELYRIRDWLAKINRAAAHSLEEGLEETLTVTKLKLPASLQRLFSQTNMIESAFSLADDLCHNVKSWRDGNMAWRWAGTVLLEAEKRFRRIRGYRDMPFLLKALQKLIAKGKTVA